MVNIFSKKLKDYERAARSVSLTFPSRAGDIALRFINGNFKAQGYQGITFMRWAMRKAQEKKKSKRSILVDKGRLRRGNRKEVRGAGTVAILNDAPYANVHNRGLKAGRGNGFNMPKRQFAPIDANDSPTLINAIKRDIFKQLNFK